MYLLELALIVVICSVLSSVAYVFGLLNLSGSAMAFIVGFILGIQGGIIWILLLLIFLASSFIATKYKFDYKEEKGFQEGKKGERGAINVLANGLVPIVIALLHAPQNSYGLLNIGFLSRSLVILLFVTAVASAASDTLASEMGVLSDDTYLITNFKRVEPGTNGGISLYGEIWAFGASLYTFLVAYGIFYLLESIPFPTGWMFIGISMGFISCQFDSLLGATLERRKIIGKSMVNVLSISSAVMITGVIIWLI